MIALAKTDYALSQSQKRNGVLCVTFIRASMQTAMTVYSNMLQVQGFCNWAIILYDGSKDFENDICSKIKANPLFKVVVCKRSNYALNDGGIATTTSSPLETKSVTSPIANDITVVANSTEQISNSTNAKMINHEASNAEEVEFLDPSVDQPPLNETELQELNKLEEISKEVNIEDTDDNSVSIDDDDAAKIEDLILRKDRKAVPKSVLYSDLLPYLPNFKRVFLMDEDISLVGFDFVKTMDVWSCAFHPFAAPLVVQPLIAESNQYFSFVGIKAWTGKGVVASASGIIEQQVPMFDAVFFEWFVKRCLSLTKQDAINAGVDWGGDRSWCNAAKMYGREVLKQRKEYVHCALLVGSSPVHHLNTKAIATKRTNRKDFLKNGFDMVDKYVALFPTWTILDILRSPNPLDRLHGRKYSKSKILDANCTANMKFIF